MGRFGQIAGTLLLVSGILTGAWGAPYYMLDWGSVFVISGVMLACTGLLSLLLGSALVRLSEMEADFAAIHAAVALEARAAAEQGMIAAEAEAPVAPIGAVEPGPAPTPSVEARPPASPAQNDVFGPALGGIAVAGAAAGGLAVTAHSILKSVAPEPEPVPEAPPALHDASAIRSSAQDAEFSIDDADRQALASLSARAAAGDLAADEPDASTEAPLPGNGSAVHEAVDAAEEPEDTMTVEPHAPNGDGRDLYARVESAVREVEASARALDARRDDMPSGPSWRDAAPAEDAGTMTPAPERAMPAQKDGDLYADLRADLGSARQGQSMAGPRPESEDLTQEAFGVVLGRTDFEEPEWTLDTPETQGPALTVPAQAEPPPMPAPPPAAAHAAAPDRDRAETRLERGGADQASELADHGSEADAPSKPDAPPDRTEPVAAESPGAVADRALAAQPKVASIEGVVAAYTVGDSAYAMLADGRIRVTTPDAEHLFGSMDELKTFMAERRARIT